MNLVMMFAGICLLIVIVAFFPSIPLIIADFFIIFRAIWRLSGGQL